VILIYTVESGKSLGSDRGKKTSTQNDDKLIADKIRICYLLKIHLVKQELPTFPEHPSSPPVFSGAGVTRCLVICVCFVDRCLSFGLTVENYRPVANPLHISSHKVASSTSYIKIQF
jgi:hypothetical protein